MENWGAAELRALFGGSADVAERQITAGGQKLDVLFLDGLTSGGDIAEQVLQSAHADGAARQHAGGARPGGAGTGLLRRGRAGHGAGGRRGQAAARLLRRASFPARARRSASRRRPSTRRGPSAPESENTVKGAKDAFTETMRINTSLLRRHLRTAQLRFVQKTVGPAERRRPSRSASSRT